MTDQRNIHAVPYHPNNSYETRYQIIDADTGEVLDDAQGYGYRTPQKAHAAWAYKHPSKNSSRPNKNTERKIRRWMADYKKFCSGLEDYCFDILKETQGKRSFPSAKELQEFLLEEDPEVPFTAKQFRWVWRRR